MAVSRRSRSGAISKLRKTKILKSNNHTVTESDDGNLNLAKSTDYVDQINAEFYEKFPYPWPALKFECLEDPAFEAAMLNQELGDWRHQRFPNNPRIWVAGCGANQAVFTALRFQQATVLGSDLSSESLEAANRTAGALGISNLELKRESINQITYQGEFDYIISTGVVHHNADPQATLTKIAAALKPHGVLELMVYNKFHWTIPAAFQKAIRTLGGNPASPDFDWELSIAKKIIGELPPENSIGAVAEYRDFSDEMLADELLQPVLHHFTVESLADMAQRSGLELLLPCLNQFDKMERTIFWNLEFKDEDLSGRYESLPDLRRWQVTNLLLREKSPQLWFYLQHKDAGHERKTEKEVCEKFLKTKFLRAGTMQRNYLRNKDGTYKLLPQSLRYPTLSPDESVRKIVEMVDGRSTMGEIFQRLGFQTMFRTVNRARLLLTTPQFPYLKAV
jgi:SAM-dependent methyltransferase